MAVYQIDYDLRNKGSYQALYERLRSYQVWCRPLESTWVIATQESATQVRDYLLGVMDQDDGILVTRLRSEAAWHGIDAEVGSYLKSLLERQAA